jgi:hypothetical protein
MYYNKDDEIFYCKVLDIISNTVVISRGTIIYISEEEDIKVKDMFDDYELFFEYLDAIYGVDKDFEELKEKLKVYIKHKSIMCIDKLNRIVIEDTRK